MTIITRHDKWVAKKLAGSMINIIAFMFVTAVAFVIYGGKTFYRISKNIRNYLHYKDIQYSYEEIKQKILQMNGFQFEKFCGKLFEQLGNKVEHTPDRNDYGRDLIINDDTFVECKHYTGTGMQVGREVSEKLIGSMEAFNITKGIVITTGIVHQNAYEYANRLTNKNLEFINLDDIMDMLDKVQPEKIPLMIESSFAPTTEKFETIFKEIYE